MLKLRSHHIAITLTLMLAMIILAVVAISHHARAIGLFIVFALVGANGMGLYFILKYIRENKE